METIDYKFEILESTETIEIADFVDGYIYMVKSTDGTLLIAHVE